MKYIKTFSDESAYNTYINGITDAKSTLPNLSYCSEEMTSKVKPYNYKLDYFTTFILEDGTITIYKRNATGSIYYSYDLSTWTELDDQVSLNVFVDDKIYWKSNILNPTDSGTSRASLGFWRFTSTCLVNVSGNILSLYYNDNFKDKDNTTLPKQTFEALFLNSTEDNIGCLKIKSAKNLILPSKTVGISAYNCMFTNNTYLEEPPQILATSINTLSLAGIFMNCTNLKYSPEIFITSIPRQGLTYFVKGCTALTHALPLHITTIGQLGLLYAFDGCTNLQEFPVFDGLTTINATNALNCCFRLCTSLRKVKFPDTLLTFSGSHALTGLLSQDINIKYVECNFTTTPTSSISKNWINVQLKDGVSYDNIGVIKINKNATWENITRGPDTIPVGWKVLKK